jgi:PAS domain S-box-containing protein
MPPDSAPAPILTAPDEELSLVLRSISAILITLDPQGRIRLWNDAAEKVFRIGPGAARGREFATLVRWDAERLRATLESCRAEREARRIDELAFEAAPDVRGLVGMTITPMGAAGDAGFLVFGREITEQKQLEAQHAHALKLESIGQLAAGIAHEINTPTQFISDNVRFLRDAFVEITKLLELCTALARGAERDAASTALVAALQGLDLDYLRAEIPKALEESLSGLERVGKIVGAMKEFSHPGTGEKVSVDLNRAIESTVTVARNEWKYVSELELDLDPDLPAVQGLPDEINQVFLNMVVNAAHAIAEKRGASAASLGKITIRTRSTKDGVEIRIGDDGAGIPEGIRQRIFDPFFTTKGVGKGTGQGLAIARSVVVDKHGGSIAVESTVGVGTTFVIRMPLVATLGNGAKERRA